MIIALEFLKKHSIIHRDIKPKNLLIHETTIKISDFGVAKIIKNNSDKETTTFSGTVQFMSPQILMQDKYTYQTDVWSLGITFYFMVFKQMPWKSYKVLGILEEIEQQNGVSIPEEAPGVDPLLLDMMRKMLRYEEHERITVEELKEHGYIKEEIVKLEL
jgi:serine/threonine protein kinase